MILLICLGLHEKKIYASFVTLNLGALGLGVMNRYVLIILMGVCLSMGGIVNASEPMDVQQLEARAEKGDVLAQYQLGLQYRSGTRVEKNYLLGLNWFTKAARQGHVDAQNRVAICYNNGEGTLPDIVKAYAWYLVASMNGHKRAQVKQKIYASTLNKRQLFEGQRLANTIYKEIREPQ